MKITRRKLQRIIREAIDQQGNVSSDHNPSSDRLSNERQQDDYDDTYASHSGSNNIDLYLDLGGAGDFPTMTDSESEKQWEVPYFTTAGDFLDEVLSQLPGSTPDTIVYGEEMDLPDLPLSQVWDAVMAAGRRR